MSDEQRRTLVGHIVDDYGADLIGKFPFIEAQQFVFSPLIGANNAIRQSDNQLHYI